MKLVLGLAALIVAFGASEAGAAQTERLTKLDGNRLLAVCDTRNPASARGCEAYIDGIADSLTIASRPINGAHPANSACIPPDLTAPQLRESLVSWLKANAKDRNHPAAEIVLHVLRENYPCH